MGRLMSNIVSATDSPLFKTANTMVRKAEGEISNIASKIAKSTDNWSSWIKRGDDIISVKNIDAYTPARREMYHGLNAYSSNKNIDKKLDYILKDGADLAYSTERFGTIGITADVNVTSAFKHQVESEIDDNGSRMINTKFLNEIVPNNSKDVAEGFGKLNGVKGMWVRKSNNTFAESHYNVAKELADRYNLPLQVL